MKSFLSTPYSWLRKMKPVPKQMLYIKTNTLFSKITRYTLMPLSEAKRKELLLQ